MAHGWVDPKSILMMTHVSARHDLRSTEHPSFGASRVRAAVLGSSLSRRVCEVYEALCFQFSSTVSITSYIKVSMAVGL